MCNRFKFNEYTHSMLFKARPAAGKTEKKEVRQRKKKYYIYIFLIKMIR